MINDYLNLFILYEFTWKNNNDLVVVVYLTVLIFPCKSFGCYKS